jgi:hypothetical protein
VYFYESDSETYDAKMWRCFDSEAQFRFPIFNFSLSLYMSYFSQTSLSLVGFAGMNAVMD